jgi:hypothetical protein
MGIFDDQVDLYTTYRARLQFRKEIMGGTPRDPKLVMGWLKARMGVDELERQRILTIQTMQESGLLERLTPEQLHSLTLDQLEEVAEKMGESRQVNGFKRDENGLYIESRTVKALFKEATNILFAGEKWGVTRKGPKSMVAERLFIHPDKIYLGVDAPTGVQTFVGHVTGPQGPRSTLTRYEYVYQPCIEFEVKVARDFITFPQWKELWVLAQENGLGSLRSQGFGTFDLEEFEEVKAEKKGKVRAA